MLENAQVGHVGVMDRLLSLRWLLEELDESKNLCSAQVRTEPKRITPAGSRTHDDSQ